MSCGKEINDDTKEFCIACSEMKRSFDRNFAVFRYDKWMKKSIAGLKYEGRTEYASFYAEYMTRSFQGCMERLGIEMLIPVPSSKKRKRFRGFNQSELIAEKLSKKVRIPSCSLLFREKDTKPQNALNPSERNMNLRNAFSMNKRMCAKLSVIPKCVALVDDIFTTGSTLNECAEVLKKYGVRQVYGFCVCIGSD